MTAVVGCQKWRPT